MKYYLLLSIYVIYIILLKSMIHYTIILTELENEVCVGLHHNLHQFTFCLNCSFINISPMYLKEAPLHFNELLLSEEKKKSNCKDLSARAKNKSVRQTILYYLSDRFDLGSCYV